MPFSVGDRVTVKRDDRILAIDYIKNIDGSLTLIKSTKIFNVVNGTEVSKKKVKATIVLFRQEHEILFSKQRSQYIFDKIAKSEMQSKKDKWLNQLKEQRELDEVFSRLNNNLV